MRILFTIPHFYRSKANSHGSAGPNPTRRIAALSEAIISLHQNFGGTHREIDIAKKLAVPANSAVENLIDIAVFTTGDDHVLDNLPIPRELFRRVSTEAQPLMLGFECHKYLQQNLGAYDYYCFLEDDLVIHDGNFFDKLRLFNDRHSAGDLLQPNRYELAANGPCLKAYVDGNIRVQATMGFQDLAVEQELDLKWLGRSILFRRPTNPHSGCFFLTHQQLEWWCEQPFFLDRCVDFISPLESAASLGIMRAFKIWKPALSNANFLEIKHADRRFIHLIKERAEVKGEPALV